PRPAATPRTLLDSLDALIAKYNLLQHPFYRAWTEGKLTKKSLALYAEQYYQHVRAFPDNLKQLADRTKSEPKLNKLVQENLDEELDASAPHPKLGREFAQSIGEPQRSLEAATPWP